MQALYLLALDPVAEMMADKNAYGFRPLRSAADAKCQCFNALAKRHSAKYILEADIKSCFDKISHQWLLKNVPVDNLILKK
jgi:RNA-directed DNA polymerase